MTKPIFSFIFSCLLYFSASSQSSFEIIDQDNNNVIVNADTLDYFLSNDTFLYKQLTVKNISASTKATRCKRILAGGFMTDDTLILIWNAHFPPLNNTIQTAGNINIAAGGSINLFSNGIGFEAYYDPGVMSGTRIVRYVFYDNTNHNDSTYVVFRFHVISVGVYETQNPSAFFISEVNPNPSAGKSAVTYHLADRPQKALFRIYNETGLLIKELAVEKPDGKLEISTNDMANGLYFCSLFVNGKIIATKKLIVAQ